MPPSLEMPLGVAVALLVYGVCEIADAAPFTRQRFHIQPDTDCGIGAGFTQQMTLRTIQPSACKANFTN